MKKNKKIPRVVIHTSIGGSPNGYGGGNSAYILGNPVLNLNHKKKNRQKRRRKIVCGAWNIQGWRTKDKEVIDEFKRMNIDIMVISETKKKGSGIEDIDGVFHCWSGVRKEERAKAGVGVLIKNKWRKSIKSWEPINERIIKVEMDLLGRHVVILGVYGPTADRSEREREEFMETLQEQVEKVNQSQELILAGDLNGRTGRKDNDKTIGRFGEAVTNGSGERIIELCEMNSLKITNGFYRHKDIHKYTWVQETRNLRAIIDYIIVKIKTTIKIKDVRVKRGAESGTDHKLLVAIMEFPWTRGHQRSEKESNPTEKVEKKQFKLYLLREESIRDLYKRRLDQKLQEFRYESIQETYEHVKTCIKEAAGEALGEEEVKQYRYKIRLKETTEECIKEKKKLYNKWLSTKHQDDLEAYRQKNREVKRLVAKDKNEKWEETCMNIEQYIGGTRNSESWKVLKVLTKNTKDIRCFTYIQGKQWEDYYKELLTEKRPQFMETEEDTEDINPTEEISLTLDEVTRNIERIKNNKSAGPGGIAPELIKYGSEKLFRMIHRMFQRALNEDQLPKEWTEAYIVSIFKKGDRRRCENYRGVSVLSSMGRLYGKIVKEKLEEQLIDKISDDQAGFSAGRSCIDHIYTLQQLIEKKMAKNRAVHLAFIDLKKAYDSVPRIKLWETMQKVGIPKELIKATKNLYKCNRVNIKMGNKISGTFRTTKGLLQGCSTSPTLFKIFLEETLKPWKRKCEEMGVPIRDDHLYTLSFADDQVVIAQDEEDLSYMVRKLEEEYKKNGLEMNLNKTEYLTTSSDALVNLEIEDGRQLKGTDKFKYLGFIISREGTTEEEIKCRVGQSRNTIKQLNQVLWDRQITKSNKMRIYNAIVRSIMTYGAEIWVLNKRNRSKIRAAEMDFWRRSCRVSRLDRLTNEEIKQRMGVEKDTLDYIEEKCLTWYGHVRRADPSRWIAKVTDWSPVGRRKRGRPRRSWRDEVDEGMERRGLEEGEWENRDQWRLWLREGRQRQL